MEQNRGFTHAANRGAQAARGAFTLFLNNDTLVLRGAIQTLLHVMDDTSVGAAGARLVYPTGWLQEAGSIVHDDGSCSQIGWGCNPADPLLRVRRDSDYCSAAALLVRSSLLRTIGWFDLQFAPGYYEDVDLCFAIRARGLRVVVEPAATVVHWEGMTHGTEWRRGIHREHTKSLQTRNRARFAAKWNRELAGRKASPAVAPLPVYEPALRPG
jgi:GT2 family glycosyltransferase